MSCPGGSCKNQWAEVPLTTWDFQSDRLDLTFVTDRKFCEICRTIFFCFVNPELWFQQGDSASGIRFSSLWNGFQLEEQNRSSELRRTPGRTGPPPAGAGRARSTAEPHEEQPTRITRLRAALVTRHGTREYCSQLSPILHLGMRQSLMNKKPTHIWGFSGFPECFQIFLLPNRMCGIHQHTVLKTVIFNKRQYLLLS